MASTVIDSLVVKLGLDSSDFQLGQKKVNKSLDDTKKSTEKVGKDIADSGKRAADFFGQLEKAAIKFFAVLTVGRGMSDFASLVVNTGAQLDRVSGRLGVSADTLSRWQGAVRQSGGTAEGFLGTMQGLSQAITDFQIDPANAGITKWLSILKVSLVDSGGKAKSTIQLLRDFGDAANRLIPNEATRFNILKSIGIDEGTINLLMKGGVELDRLLASQKGYSDADARAAREAQEKWEGVKLQIERISQDLVIKALPALEKLANLMLKFAEVAVPVLIQVSDAIGDADKATDGWSTNLLLILGTLKLITGGGILGGLGSLKTAISGLAIAGAGFAGWKAGEEINKHLSEDTKNDVGKTVARVLAFFGNKEAQQALDVNENGAAPSPVSAPSASIPTAPSSAAAAEKTSQPSLLAPASTAKPNGNPGNLESSAAPSTPSTPAGASRAERNNNPGNLEFRGQNGAVPESGSGRFAKFNSPSEGVAALAKQLQRYGSRGIDTLRGIIDKYAPSSENNTQAYVSALSKRLGVSSDQKLDLNNSDTLSGLIKGIGRHESGKDFLSNQDVLSGLSMAGVSQSKTMPPSISVGKVDVYTQATDANGIARDLHGALIRQADTGMR